MTDAAGFEGESHDDDIPENAAPKGGDASEVAN